MIAKVREALAGLRLKKNVETVGEDDEVITTTHLLTTRVLTPVANEYITRMPNITAYAVLFETAFTWASPDRTAAGVDVAELVLGVDSLNTPGENPGNLPGVEFEVGE